MIATADILRARILIVDDQPANLALLEDMLGQEGYRNVSSTLEPQEVCALHRRNGYELILLNLQRPGIDGLELIEALRMNGEDASPGVLVINGRQPGGTLRALQAGARDFIGLPLDAIEVTTRIRNTLEVVLLYHRLELEAVDERIAELRESESRYRSLAELASDWYWEQDEHGAFTKVSGPVFEMLGLSDDAPRHAAQAPASGWNEAERAQVRSAIADRRPFLDFVFTRINPDGSHQRFQVSGEPMFGPACRLLGYRGIGLEITGRK